MSRRLALDQILALYGLAAERLEDARARRDVPAAVEASADVRRLRGVIRRRLRAVDLDLTRPRPTSPPTFPTQQTKEN